MRFKKKIGAITFHSSYNHGSVLQAYALQEFIKKKFGKIYDYQIINLRTERQKKYYDKNYKIFDIKNNLKKILTSKYNSQILDRKQKYESFINNKLHLTEEYSNINELKKANLNFDYCISGSDQIWNYKILDFDWSFFLEFCENSRRISYAASFGPKILELDEITKRRLKNDLSKYERISVRENASAEKIRQIMGEDIAEVHIDPTLLVGKKDWDRIVSNRIIENDYILLYDLKGNKNAYNISRKLSELYNIPVVVIKENAKMLFACRGFVKRYDAGPADFLNYVRNAKIIVSSSFHGTAFSVIFEKPFLAVGGRKDFRINNLLEITNLIDRAIDDVDEIDPETIFDIDFTDAKLAINKERKRSETYFAKALETEGVDHE